MSRILSLLIPLLLALPVAAQEAEPVRRPVKLMTLEAGADVIARTFYGRIRARETVDLAFQVPGQIDRFPASEGTSLAQGEMIAQLDLESFERNLRQAELNLAKAERDLERLESLSGASVSDVQIRDAETQRDLAAIAVEDARRQLDDATMQTPFDALVARREVATFTTVTAGQPVVRLHDMSELRVDIDVPEVLFRRAYGDDQVTFSAIFPNDDTRFALELREFEAETAQVGQTFRLTLAFIDRPGGWALPGASVTVVAETDPAAGEAIVVPETALVYGADRSPALMRFEPDPDAPDEGHVIRTPVEIEMRDDGRIALVDGPEPGTEIVEAGAAQLRDDQPVRRFTGMGI